MQLEVEDGRVVKVRGDKVHPESRGVLCPLRLCPRQVMGARIGLQGGRLLGLALPQVSGQKRLLTFVETDGCSCMESRRPQGAPSATG